MDVFLTGANAQAHGLAIAAARAGHAPILYDPGASPGPRAVRRRGAWGSDIVELYVTDDIAAVERATLVVINDDLHVREPLVGRLAPWLSRQHIILLNPGGFGGGALVGAQLRAAGSAAAVAELAGFPLLVEVDGATVTLTGMKHDLPIAVHPTTRADEVCRIVGAVLPAISPARPALEVGLANTNHVIHPPLTLVNAVRIERAEPFLFYRDGLSEGALRLIHGIDRERLALAARMDVAAVPLERQFATFYAAEGMRGAGLYDQLRTFEPFDRAAAPSTLRHRYVLDDLAYGLVPMARVCELLGVPAPLMRATIAALGAVCEHDFWSGGVTADAIGAGCAPLAALIGMTTMGGTAATD